MMGDTPRLRTGREHYADAIAALRREADSVAARIAQKTATSGGSANTDFGNVVYLRPRAAVTPQPDAPPVMRVAALGGARSRRRRG